MSTILTQAEIDALLADLADGGTETQEEPKETYKLHDFRTANKFSKEQMRTLNSIFDNFSYMLATRLTGLLRTICDVKVTSVEELVFSDFNNAVTSPSILAIIDAPPMQGSFLLELSPAVAYALIVRTLGGVAATSGTTKKFTEIELAVVENILNQVLRLFVDAWKKVIDIHATLQRIETSPQFAQIAAMNEPAAVITLNVKIDSVEEIIAFCIPHYVLQPIAKRLNSMLWNVQDFHREGMDSQSPVIAKHLDETYVNLTAKFNDIEVPLEDVLWLRPGDVLCLNQSVNEYITVLVEHIPKFQGILGVAGNKQVIQIADVIKGDEQN